VPDERAPFVGIVQLHPRSDTTLELLYGVAPKARGRGIATAALTLVSSWALEELRCERVELRIDEGHRESQRVAEKAGFRFAEKIETFVTGTGSTHIDLLFCRSLTSMR
jgi:RimJ/RimL family protein N-acetyltransferase